MTDSDSKPPTSARVPLVGDAEDPALEVLFEPTRQANRRIANIQRAIGNSPPVALAFASFSETARNVPWLAASDVELVILRVAVKTGCPYPFSHHVAPGVAAGLSEEQIRSLWTWESAECFSPDQRLLLQAVDEIEADAGLSADTFDRLSARFEPKEMVELVTLVGFYGMLARFANSCGAPVDDDVRINVERLWQNA